jgi:hypothetical protein
MEFALLLFNLFRVAMALAFDLSAYDPAQLSFHREGDKLRVEFPQADGSKGVAELQLTQVRGGSVFYHWADGFHIDQYAKEGMISPERMAGMNVPQDKLQEFGPGFYVSSNPFDSRSFGDKSVEVHTPPEEFFLLTTNKDTEVHLGDPEKVKVLFEKLREQGILGSKLPNATWYVLYDPKITADVRPFDFTTYLKDNLKKLATLTPEQALARDHLLADKALDAQDLLTLTATGTASDLPLEINSSMMLKVQQDLPGILAEAKPGDAKPVVAQLVALYDDFSHSKTPDKFVPAHLEAFRTLTKTLGALEDPAQIRPLLPRLDGFLQVCEVFQSEAPPALASAILHATATSPEFVESATSLMRWFQPGLLPPSVARWVPTADSSLTKEFARQLGISPELALKLRNLLYSQRYYPLAPAVVVRLLAGVEIPPELALRMLRMAGKNPPLFSTALSLARKVETPTLELYEAALKGLLDQDFDLARGTKDLLARWAPALRSQLVPAPAFLVDFLREHHDRADIIGALREGWEKAGLAISTEPAPEDPCQKGFAKAGTSGA